MVFFCSTSSRLASRTLRFASDQGDLGAADCLQIWLVRRLFFPAEVGAETISRLEIRQERCGADVDAIFRRHGVAACDQVPKAVVHLMCGQDGRPFTRVVARLETLLFVGIFLVIAIAQPQRVGPSGAWDFAADFDGEMNGPSDGDGNVALFRFKEFELGPRRNAAFGKGREGTPQQGKELRPAYGQLDEHSQTEAEDDCRQPQIAASTDGRFEVGFGNVAGRLVADGGAN